MLCLLATLLLSRMLGSKRSPCLVCKEQKSKLEPQIERFDEGSGHQECSEQFGQLSEKGPGILGVQATPQEEPISLS